MKKHPTTGTGKGDRYRDVDKDKYSDGWDRIWGKKKKKKKK